MSLCGRKRKRENERWHKRENEGEGEERREREREKENGENGARGALPSLDAFPSTKLGNNMTPIKGSDECLKHSWYTHVFIRLLALFCV